MGIQTSIDTIFIIKNKQKKENKKKKTFCKKNKK